MNIIKCIYMHSNIHGIQCNDCIKTCNMLVLLRLRRHADILTFLHLKQGWQLLTPICDVKEPKDHPRNPKMENTHIIMPKIKLNKHHLRDGEMSFQTHTQLQGCKSASIRTTTCSFVFSQVHLVRLRLATLFKLIQGKKMWDTARLKLESGTVAACVHVRPVA